MHCTSTNLQVPYVWVVWLSTWGADDTCSHPLDKDRELGFWKLTSWERDQFSQGWGKLNGSPIEPLVLSYSNNCSSDFQYLLQNPDCDSECKLETCTCCDNPWRAAIHLPLMCDCNIGLHGQRVCYFWKYVFFWICCQRKYIPICTNYCGSCLYITTANSSVAWSNDTWQHQFNDSHYNIIPVKASSVTADTNSVECRTLTYEGKTTIKNKQLYKERTWMAFIQV